MQGSARPLYESDQTRIAEEASMRNFAAAFDCSYRKLGIKNVIDYAMLRGERVVAWVECKRRLNQRDRYPTLMLSLHKWVIGRNMARASGKPFYLAVEWDDGLFWLNSARATFDVGFGGRTDRNDAQDIEPCVFIPIAQFDRL